MTIATTIEDEKKRVIEIKIGTAHRALRDKWLNIKRVLDALYKELSPLNDNNQSFSFNPTNLPNDQRKIFSSVLEDLLKSGITDYEEKGPRIIASSTYYRKYLNGEIIIVKNRKAFEDYKYIISEFCDFIENDGKKRFPELYGVKNEMKIISFKRDITTGGQDGFGLIYDVGDREVEIQISRTVLAMWDVKNAYSIEDLLVQVHFSILIRKILDHGIVKKIDIHSGGVFVDGTFFYSLDDAWKILKNDLIPVKNEKEGKDTDEVEESYINKENRKNILTDSGSIKRAGDNIKPAIGVEVLSGEVAKILVDMNGNKGSIFGVFGKWGRGKTFLINQIKKEKIIKDNFHIVNFHAWKYQDTPASWAYLYEEFVKSYYGKVDIIKNPFIKNKNVYKVLNFIFVNFIFCIDWIILKIKELLKILWLNFYRYKILSILIFIIILLINFFIEKIPVPDSVFKNINERLVLNLGIGLSSCFALWLNHKKEAFRLIKKYTTRKDFIQYLGVQYEVQEEIKKLFKAWLKFKKKTLLVVDDLDRCPENKIIQIVDSLRVMLEDEEIENKIVVVIAVDERILKLAIQHKYSKLLNNETVDDTKKDDVLDMEKIMKEYMDKLFLCGIKLGNLTNDEKIEILDKLTGGKIIQTYKETNIDTSINAKTERIDIEQQQEKISEIDKVNKDQVTSKEKNYIESSICSIGNMTPRQIDIYFFRYLLARNILRTKGVETSSPEKLCIFLSHCTRDGKFDRSLAGEQVSYVLDMVVAY